MRIQCQCDKADNERLGIMAKDSATSVTMYVHQSFLVTILMNACLILQR